MYAFGSCVYGECGYGEFIDTNKPKLVKFSDLQHGQDNTNENPLNMYLKE